MPFLPCLWRIHIMNIHTINPSCERTFGSYFLIAIFVITMALILLVSGCATPAPVQEVEEVPEMVWPNPPDEAVIRYVGFVRDVEVMDMEKRPSFQDIIAGKDPDETAKTLNKPFGVYGDGQGRLFVTDTALGALVVFDLESGKIERWGETGMGALSKPIGITSDANGQIYVCDVLDRRVVVFDEKGQFVNTFGGKEIFENPVAIAINDKLKRIYVLDSRKHQLMVFDMQGKHLFSVGEKGGEPGNFMYPTGIAIGADGRLFISDSMNFRVQILDADGVHIKSFGEIGQNVGDFNRPKGIALDRDGHIYVVDGSFANFQVFDEDGQLLMYVGENGSAPGQFFLPTGIHIDGQNKIYVADQINHRVQIFEYLGKPEGKPEQEPEPKANVAPDMDSQ